MDPCQNALIERYTTSAATASTYRPHPEGIAAATTKTIAATSTDVPVMPFNNLDRSTPITWMIRPRPKVIEAEIKTPFTIIPLPSKKILAWLPPAVVASG